MENLMKSGQELPSFLNNMFKNATLYKVERLTEPMTKETGKEQLARYFMEVFKLNESGEEFPVNLDMVWPLVFTRKDKAINALKSSKNFIKGVDFQVFPQKVENPLGGRPSETIVLTVPCLEFFIARKVREVFEVYRLVFHAARKNDPEVEKLKDLVNHASAVVGSINKLAKHMGVSAATFTNLFKQPQVISAEMRSKIETSCTNIIENGVGIDKDWANLIMHVSDDELRLKMWEKIRV